ncbi:dienelactone hydrolase family protein [Luteolibacter yonseiensis]|uniref:Dienelactone hydrolase family protein n=1 Tax=Luteolibacter yonseiensis TaxID=1144680 RepID=A0A934V6C0_9BACT|nr:dienelactone hydrolase family protein [Luteolibacter yonseiensis]MBK1814867.1 dienelactone hydrolase family protein [Luteolibacter yonseiensis]
MKSILAVSLLGCCLSTAADLQALEWKAKDGTVVKYRWSAPEKIEAGKTYPLVLFLHGAGERGTDNSAQLKHGVRAILNGAEKLGQPIFLIAPQCPPGRWWSPASLETGELTEADKPNALVDAVIDLTKDTEKKFPVDPKRFYVTGISMGGFATWDVLGRESKHIAAAIPICGGGDPGLAKRYEKTPIWTFHGEADPVVPVKTTRTMVEALEKAGGKPKVTYYPGVEHDSWTQTYDNIEVIRWLFEQRLK